MTDKMPRLALKVGLAAMCVWGAQPALAEGEAIPPERQSELLYILKQDCGSCHGLTLRGGLGPALTPADLENWDAEMIASAIYDGIPKSPMPPWREIMNRQEAMWLAQILKAGDRMK